MGSLVQWRSPRAHAGDGHLGHVGPGDEAERQPDHGPEYLRVARHVNRSCRERRGDRRAVADGGGDVNTDASARPPSDTQDPDGAPRSEGPLRSPAPIGPGLLPPGASHTGHLTERPEVLGPVQQGSELLLPRTGSRVSLIMQHPRPGGSSSCRNYDWISPAAQGESGSWSGSRDRSRSGVLWEGRAPCPAPDLRTSPRRRRRCPGSRGRVRAGGGPSRRCRSRGPA